jgi:uncharacterized membrane protein
MAIAITLLVLDLKVPSTTESQSAGSLIAALAGRWPSYAAYLAAFLTIGIIWLNHRAFVDRIRHFDGTLHWLNLASFWAWRPFRSRRRCSRRTSPSPTRWRPRRPP